MAKMRDDILKELAPGEEIPETELRARVEKRVDFETELFGEDSLLLRAIPSEWGNEDLRTRLRNLVDRLLSVSSPDNSLNDTSTAQTGSQLVWDETLFEALASEACHSAIRAGDVLDNSEAEALVDSLFKCQHPWNCPHGRPTVVRMPRARFEEWFQRRV